jgi:hypothetical protein
MTTNNCSEYAKDSSECAALSNSQIAEMEQYNITFDGNKFCYLEYRYDKLQDAISYSKRNPKPQSTGNQAKESYLNSISQKFSQTPIITTVMGGSGWNIPKGSAVFLSCGKESIQLSNIQTENEIKILFSELVNAEVTGSGQ